MTDRILQLIRSDKIANEICQEANTIEHSSELRIALLQAASEIENQGAISYPTESRIQYYRYIETKDMKE